MFVFNSMNFFKESVYMSKIFFTNEQKSLLLSLVQQMIEAYVTVSAHIEFKGEVQRFNLVVNRKTSEVLNSLQETLGFESWAEVFDLAFHLLACVLVQKGDGFEMGIFNPKTYVFEELIIPE